MSSNNSNSIPKPTKTGLKSAFKETAEATMAIALREVIALGDVMMELDVTDTESLKRFAYQSERANQAIGYIHNKVNHDRDMVERGLTRLGADSALAIKLTEAGKEGAEGVRAEIRAAVDAILLKYKSLLDEAISLINNGADN